MPVLLVTLLWRVPSLFDPPWVNDEGTYFAVAQAMAHGYRLYAGVWENKLPAIYLFYGAVYHVFGPSLIAIRLLTSLDVLLLVVAVFAFASNFYSMRSALFAALLTGVLMGVPFLEGTTGNAETFLALFSATAMYLGLVRRAPGLAGLAMAIAVLFKAVAGFDAIALGLWFLLHERQNLPRYGGAIFGVLALTSLVTAFLGIFPAMIRDAIFYDLGYVGHANGSAVPWLLLVKLVLLCSISFLLRRAPFPYLWLLYATAGAFVSGRFFGHYGLQMVAPLTLSVAAAAPRFTARNRALVALAVALVVAVAGTSVAGWALAAAGHDSILARRLQYYPNFARYALQTESYDTYRSQVDDHVNRNIAVAALVAAGPPGNLLIWGNTPWIYVLSHRLPATAYTSAVRDPAVPGETKALDRSLTGLRPTQVVVIDPPLPPIRNNARSALLLGYRAAGSIANARVLVREPSPSRLAESARTTARTR
ncbi:MAG: ArnT family glycosyltransferase [Chloroflexota bacterium]